MITLIFFISFNKELLKLYLNNKKNIQSFLLATVWFMWNMQSNIFLKWSKQFSSRLTRVHLLFILERGFRSWYLSSLVNIIAVYCCALHASELRLAQNHTAQFFGGEQDYFVQIVSLVKPFVAFLWRTSFFISLFPGSSWP